MNRRDFLPVLAAPLVALVPRAPEPKCNCETLPPRFRIVRISEDWKVSADYPGFQTVCWQNAEVTIRPV